MPFILALFLFVSPLAFGFGDTVCKKANGAASAVRTSPADVDAAFTSVQSFVLPLFTRAPQTQLKTILRKAVSRLAHLEPSKLTEQTVIDAVFKANNEFPASQKISREVLLRDVAFSLFNWMKTPEGFLGTLPAKAAEPHEINAELAIAYVDSHRPEGMRFLGDSAKTVIGEVAAQLTFRARHGARLTSLEMVSGMVEEANTRLGERKIRSPGMLRDLKALLHTWAAERQLVSSEPTQIDAIHAEAVKFVDDYRPEGNRLVGNTAKRVIEHVVHELLALGPQGIPPTLESLKNSIDQVNATLPESERFRFGTIQRLAIELHYWSAYRGMVPGVEKTSVSEVARAGIELKLPVEQALAAKEAVGMRKLEDLASAAAMLSRADGPVKALLQEAEAIFKAGGTLVEQREKFYKLLQRKEFEGMPPQWRFLFFLSARTNSNYGLNTGRDQTPEQRQNGVRLNFLAQAARFLETNREMKAAERSYANEDERIAAENIEKSNYEIIAYGRYGMDAHLAIPQIGEYGEPSADILGRQKSDPKSYLIAEIKPSSARKAEDLDHALNQITNTLEYLKYHVEDPEPKVRLEVVMHSTPGREFQLYNDTYQIKGDTLFLKETGRPVSIDGRNVFVRIVERP